MAIERGQADAGFRTAATFASKLSTLKQNGCNLLVVGSDHEPTRSDACRRLLACGGNESRRRVVVAANTVASTVRTRLPSASLTPGGEPTTIIDWEIPTRGASAAANPRSSRVETVRVEANDLSQLGIEIHEAITASTSVGAAEPANLRLCFDSLTPLVERYDHETAFRFLHLVTGCVDRARGMGHYHLPVGRNAETTRTFEPLFDAIVELRAHAGRSEQRWHVPDEDITTDWLPV